MQNLEATSDYHSNTRNIKKITILIKKNGNKIQLSWIYIYKYTYFYLLPNAFRLNLKEKLTVKPSIKIGETNQTPA